MKLLLVVIAGIALVVTLDHLPVTHHLIELNQSMPHGDLSWLGLLLVVYFVPALVAKLTHKRDWAAIATLNLLLGWTLLGWVGALVWAMMRDQPAPANPPVP